MFKRILFFSLLGWLFILLIGLIFFLNVRPEDKEKFYALMNLSEGGEGSDSSSGRQQREGIKKEMWIEKEGELFHLRLTSENAVVTIEKHNERSEVKEELENLLCLIQESVNTKENWQIIELIRAETATYFYKTDRFIANQVTIEKFKIPGVELPQTLPPLKPMMTGNASQMEFSIGLEGIKIQATNMRATLDSL